MSSSFFEPNRALRASSAMRFTSSWRVGRLRGGGSLPGDCGVGGGLRSFSGDSAEPSCDVDVGLSSFGGGVPVLSPGVDFGGGPSEEDGGFCSALPSSLPAEKCGLELDGVGPDPGGGASADAPAPWEPLGVGPLDGGRVGVGPPAPGELPLPFGLNLSINS